MSAAWDDQATTQLQYPLVPSTGELVSRSLGTVRAALRLAAKYGADTPKGRAALNEARVRIRLHNSYVRIHRTATGGSR